MILDRIHIKNYKSISDETIDFNKRCRVLVGINESGKTNILEAMSLLEKKKVSSISDKREALKGEKEISESFVRFYFKLPSEDYTELIEEMRVQILISNPNIKENIITVSGKGMDLESFAKSKEVFYEADIIKGVKSSYHFSLDKSSQKINKNLKKVLSTCPPEFAINVDGEEKKIKDYKYVLTDKSMSIPVEYLGDITPEEINTLVGGILISSVSANLPEIIYWRYDESKTLPTKIPLAQFVATTDTCIPLKRMFELKGITDIKSAIETAQKGGGKSLDNLLGRVADATSKYFHDTWKEYKKVSFSLKINGADIETSIQDESNSYEISQRSDGFKRFITFLLVVSSRSKTKALIDGLILIDEPEAGLHPTGAKYLRDELIKVSEDNYVVYSTHSIFMIDNKMIDRHLIILKEKEITKTKIANSSNLKEEELLYQALGHSIYSSLHEKNIIFEGWHDKELFDLAINSKLPTGYAGLKKQFNDIGICYAQGASDIKNISPLFASGDRKCLILSDSDNAAKINQKDFINAKCYGTWKLYEEVLNTCTAFTGEDFVKHTAFKDVLEEVRTTHGFTVDPSPPDLSSASSGGKGKVYVIQQWIIKNGITGDPLKKIMKDIKEKIFTTIKSSDIENNYYEYLKEAGKLLTTL